MSPADIDNLIKRHPLVSDQINPEELRVILRELAAVIEQGTVGAIVEFGCYRGTTSLFIRRLLDHYQDGREFHVYDSFQGLPPKKQQDNSVAGDQFQAGELTVSKKQLSHEFHKAQLKSPVVHKAWFNQLTDRDVPTSIAFAFLDGDFYASIMDSLKLVYPRMSRGGRIVIDDYNREALPGVSRAVHDYFDGKTVQVRTQSSLAIIET
jgi:O-methyltransferase